MNIRMEDLLVTWLMRRHHNLLGLSEEAQIQEDDLRSAIFLDLDKCGKLPGNWHKEREG